MIGEWGLGLVLLAVLLLEGIEGVCWGGGRGWDGVWVGIWGEELASPLLAARDQIRSRSFVFDSSLVNRSISIFALCRVRL